MKKKIEKRKKSIDEDSNQRLLGQVLAHTQRLRNATPHAAGGSEANTKW